MRKLLSSLLMGFSALAVAAPVIYEVDANHTLPRFSYDHMGFSTQLSRFDKTTGTITLDRAAKTGSVEIAIDARSVNTGSVKFNEHIQAAEFLDTANFPSATFKSTQFNFEGDAPKSVAGTLTIKGITKSVKLDLQSFKCMPHPRYKKEACGTTAVTVVKRSDFNMGAHVPMVGDEVTITIPVEAIAQ